MLFEAIKNDISNYYANLLINLSDAHSFFHTVGARRKSAKTTKVGAVSDEEGVIHEGDDKLAQLFVNHFFRNDHLTVLDHSSISSRVDAVSSSWRDRRYIGFSTECPALPNDVDSCPSELVTLSEVKEVIASRNNKLSVGTDNMPNRILKLLDDDIIAILATVFNQLIAVGYIPDTWKVAIVVPIPKSGRDLSVVNNWRPISLLPCVAKIFERLLAVRIRNFLSIFKIIPDHQFAFIPGHSTSHPLAILQNIINDNLNKGVITTTVCLDVQAAFDTVWHKGLIYKLHKLKLPLYLISMLKSFLTNRKFRVRIGNTFSVFKPLPAGIPQGSVLGPLLFIMYCCDIPVSNEYQLLQFADDTSLTFSYSAIKGVESRINNSIACIVGWFKKWKFRLNVNKTELIHFVGNCKQINSYKRKKLKEVQVKIDDIIIFPSKKIKYLGLVLSCNNRAVGHVDKALSKLTKAKNSIAGLLYSNFIDVNFKRLLYTMYLRPILTYASQVWNIPSNLSSHQMERLRLAERKLIRCTHNIFRARNSFKYASNSILYDTFKYDRIDVYMSKLSVKFHERNVLSSNLLIRNVTKEYVLDVNASGFLQRTDFLYNLFLADKLFDQNNRLTLFNRAAFRPHISLYSEAQ